MGCDIHMVLERRVNGKWIAVDTFGSHHSANPPADAPMDGFSYPVARRRNYERFAALAGVRGDGPEPHGLPDDLSETTRLAVDDWGGDGHSHSWLPLMDAAKIFAETDGRELSDWAKSYPESYYFNAETHGKSVDDFRLVFWFDN